MESTARNIINLSEARESVLEDEYQTGYTDGYNACAMEYRRRAIERKKAKKAELRRKRYFFKQKMMGVLVLALTMFAIYVLDGDATISFVMVPVGCLLLFSKEKVWMDDYFFETEMEGTK